MGWPPGVLQGFKVHCFARAVLLADLCGSKAQLSLANHCEFLHPLLLCLVTRVSILSGKLFPVNYFSVTVPVGGRSFGWFSRSRVAMDTSLRLMASGTPLTFKASVLKLI